MQTFILRSCATLLLFILFFVAADLPHETAHAQRSQREKLSELTIKLASAEPGDRFAGGDYEAAARERFEMLQKAIESDPAEVLRVALPENVLRSVPPEMQGLFEKRDGLEGELEVLAECEEHDGRIHYFLRRGEERHQLFFPSEPQTELLTGARVRLSGIQIDNKIAAHPDGIIQDERYVSHKDPETQNSALPGTTGEIKVLVLLVNFQNDTRTPYTTAQANNLLFNNANSSSVTNFYREASYGQTWVTGTTGGWYTLPINAECNQSTIANYAKQAATNAGVNLALYDKYMYVFPRITCSGGWVGWGEIGGRQTWINGAMDLRVTSHELAHNLGLGHAQAMKCGSEVLGPSCTTTEYGHTVDIMGTFSSRGHFHAFHKERLGWLNAGASPPITTVQSSGTYTISPLASQDWSPKALKILKSVDSNGRKTWYHLEFRQSVGFDNFISSSSNLMNGILFTMNNEVFGSQNYLLDMTPSTSQFTDAALTANRSYSDTSVGVTVTTSSVGPAGAAVEVNFGAVPCAFTAPTLTADPAATQWIGAGSTATYNVSISNNDSGSCPSSSFNVAVAVPTGWNHSASTPIVTLSPGATASVVMSVTSPGNAGNGFYNVAFSGSNANSNSGTIVRDLAVYSSLDVLAATSQAVYSTNQTLTVTATVTASGAPMAGIPVNFQVSPRISKLAVENARGGGKGGGGGTTTISGSAITNSNGVATFTYKFNRNRDPLGIYEVAVSATSGSASGAGTTIFELR